MSEEFFTAIGNTKPYFKAAFQGFAGSGKTHTAAQVAIGLHKRIGSKKPIVIFDTERASKFLKPLFADAGIEVLVRESKSLADLKTTMEFMEAGNADILVIDSISHVWESTLASYMESKRRSRLEFQDWGIIKPAWKKEFSDRFVSGQYHAIFTGRAGYEYGNEKNEETGKREVFKSGVKMKVEGETAYEPDMLIFMERFEEILGDDKKVWREATIIKDRSTLLDGKTFKDPSYASFEPAIEALLDNPVPPNAFVTPEGDTTLLFKQEENVMQFRRDRDKALEELDGFLTRLAPGATGKDKQLKLELLEYGFGTTSETAIAEMTPGRIREGRKAIIEECLARSLVHKIELNGETKIRFGAPGILTAKEEQTVEAATAAVEPRPKKMPKHAA